MTQPSDIPARYSPGRDASGKFLPGNRISVGNGTEQLARFKELKALYLSAFTDEKMNRLLVSLFDLAENAKVEDVRLRAIMYAIDRVIGPIVKRVEHEVSDNRGPLVNVNYSPTLVAEATEIVRKLRSGTPLEGVIDAIPMEGGRPLEQPKQLPE